MFYRYRTSVFVALALVLNMSLSPVIHARQSSNVVPRDTVMKVILNETLSSKETKVGEKFTATLADDVVVDGRTMIRRGAVIDGTVTKVEKAKRMAGITGRASLMLAFDRIRTNGTTRPMTASVVSVHDPVAVDDDDDDQKVNEEGEVKAKTDTKDILTKGAIGVAAGAVLGALFGNVSRGILLGTIGGAVAILAPKGKEVNIPEGSGLQIRLDRDLNLGTT